MKLPNNFRDFLNTSTFHFNNASPNSKIHLLNSTISGIGLATIRNQFNKQSQPTNETKIFTAFWLSLRL